MQKANVFFWLNKDRTFSKCGEDEKMKVLAIVGSPRRNGNVAQISQKNLRWSKNEES